MRYSGFRVFAEGLGGNKGWKPAWRDPDPKPEYDIVIIGGGGHGLSTAYYLAKNHGLTNIAVLEKGYLGGGNVGRNTTIVRANYFLPGNQEFYSHSLKLWEGLEAELKDTILPIEEVALRLAVLRSCEPDVHDDVVEEVLTAHLPDEAANPVVKRFLALTQRYTSLEQTADAYYG